MLIKKNKGMSLLEIMISVAVLGVIVVTVAHFHATSIQINGQLQDKEFAARKAVTILEEIRALAERAVDLNEELAEIEDEEENFILTLHKITNPTHPLSGNSQIIKSNGQNVFKFSRRIEFERFGGAVNSNIRMARVTVSVTDRNGKVTPLVGIGTIIQAPLQVFPPSQVYDIYLLTAESSPSWWVHMSQTRDNFESQLIDLQARNPGLTFRTHFVTANGYGRNPMYLPYINQEQHSVDDKMALGYIYPGTHQYTDGTSNANNPGMYYFPQIFQARYNEDGVIKNNFQGQDALDNPQAGVVYNPFPHAFCDRFNQDMRYPDALHYFSKKTEARREYTIKRRQFLKERADELRATGSSDKDPRDMPELPAEEPSWRILLEQMVTEPEKFHNAIFLNLHGELLPLPAIRNYSDAAKDPDDFPGIRVVTHPERIWTKQDKNTPNNSQDLKFRVYSYLSDPVDFDDTYNENVEGIPNTTPNRMPVPITIVFKNVDLTDNINDEKGNSTPSLVVERIVGGFPWTKDNTNSNYEKENAPIYKAETDDDGNNLKDNVETGPGVAGDPDDTSGKKNEMHVKYRLLKIDTNNDLVPDTFHTILYLYNSPLACPQVSGRGLASNRRLYGLEYIPNPVIAPNTTTDFRRELTNGTSGNFKNTARWVITIPKKMAISGGINPDPRNTIPNIVSGQDSFLQLRVETRIGTDLGPLTINPDQFTAGVGVLAENDNHSGTMYPPEKRFKPENLSTTYAWWTSDLSRVPFTELFQYMGDPRHNPYVDNIAKASWPTSNFGSVGDGYNPYWDDINNWDAIIDDAATENGWGNDKPEVDIPRYHQLVRRAIINSELLYTTLTGFSYFYVSVGGEIGVDAANGFPKSVQVNSAPYGNSGTGTTFVDEYSTSGNNNGVRYLRKTRTGNDFPLLFWLGELYHDNDYDDQWGIEITENVPNGQALDASKVIGGNIIARNGNNYRRVSRKDEAFRAEDTSVSNTSRLLSEDGSGNEIACRHRLSGLGCGAILHVQNTNGKIFRHVSKDNQFANIVTDGEALATEYSLPLPATIKSSRPWDINGGINGNQFEFSNHTFWRDRFFVITKGEILRTYYHHSGSLIGSGLLRLDFRNDSTNLAKSSLDPFFRADNNGYVAVNGLDRATEEATSTINKLSLLTLLHSFLELGLEFKARMLPRLVITKPDLVEPLPRDPDVIQTAWRIDFRRWDGRTYTPAYGANSYPPASDQGFPFRPGTTQQELDNLFFVPMITQDLASPWTDVIQLQKGETDEAILLRESGERPNDPTGNFEDYSVVTGSLISINADGEYVFNLDVSDESLYPTGTYFFRVEYYRKNEQLHFGFHQIVLDIKR